MAGKSEMNAFQKSKVFFSQVRTEMDKVSWPSKEDVKTYTIVVLASAIIVSILIGGWDWLLAQALSSILQATGGA